MSTGTGFFRLSGVFRRFHFRLLTLEEKSFRLARNIGGILSQCCSAEAVLEWKRTQTRTAALLFWLLLFTHPSRCQLHSFTSPVTSHWNGFTWLALHFFLCAYVLPFCDTCACWSISRSLNHGKVSYLGKRMRARLVVFGQMNEGKISDFWPKRMRARLVIFGQNIWGQD